MDVINSWWSRPHKHNLPEPTALQALRARQIEQLKNIGSGCRVVEVLRDQEYHVAVDEKSGLCLKISLPMQFPQEKPIVSVSPRVSHPWISEQMQVIGCQGINSFVVHSDLGKVIREIIDEFRCNPPVDFIPSSVQSLRSNQNTVPSSYRPVHHHNLQFSHLPHDLLGQSHNASPSTDQTSSSETQNYDFFDVSSIASRLSKMSLEDIERLRDDDQELFEMVDLLPQVQKVSNYQKHKHDQLKTQASENLSKKSLLEDKKRTILERYEQLNELRNEFDASSRRQDELLEMLSPQALQAKMKVAAFEAEKAAEAVAEEFTDGKIAVEEFIKTFMAQRTLSHVRHAKEEKCLASKSWKY